VAVSWLLVLTLLTGACSFRFIYHQLDWLVPWRLSDYVTFDSEQRSLLEQRLFDQLAWHCSTQLENYAAWFRELQQAPQPFTRNDIERYYHRSTEYWEVLMRQLSPDVAALLQSADREQVEELFANLERRNRELDEEYVSADWETVQSRRVERMREILSRWIGALNVEQERVVIRWAKELGQSGNEWIVSRRRWQAALRESLSLRNRPERFEARILQLLIEPDTLWPEAYKREYARMRSRTLDMLAEVSAMQTPEQARRLHRKFGAWADDFDRLACATDGSN
jgi:hypothetical protein